MKEKMIFLVRNVAKDKFGGGEIYQLSLARELKKNGFEPIILTNSKQLLTRAKKEKIKTLCPPYIENQNWSGWRNILLPIYYVYQLRLKKWYKNIFKEYKPAVVNIQSRDEWIATTLAAKELGIRVLWTDHADFRNWVLWNVNDRLKNAIGKKIIKVSQYAEKVIFVSENIELETRAMIAPKTLVNSIVIKNGVNDLLGDYKNIKEIKNSFVFVGRIVKEKGVGELIEAFCRVAEKHLDTELNIYGDGEDLEEYKKLVSNNKRIHFYGRTNEPLRVMAENEIFVLPSYREGLSLSLLDAAMMGKKIIASDIDGNLEVVADKKTGLLVPIKNVDKLVEAMIYVLENKKQAEEMAKNARRFYEENFDFKKIFKEKMLSLYNKEKEKE